jgi:tetratricopeptide (TPR) repeat protein
VFAFTEAATVFNDTLSTTFPSEDHSENEARFLTIGWSVNRQILVVAHTEDAHRHFTQAVAVGRRTGSSPALVRALKGLGQIERDLGRGDCGLPLYEEAIRICRSEGAALRLAHTVRHLDDIHQDAGRSELAEPCYREALAIYRSHGQTTPLDLANTLRPFAILQETLGQPEQAIDLWTEARDLYARLNLREGVAESTDHLSRLGA